MAFWLSRMQTAKPYVYVEDLGLISYGDCWAYQTAIHQRMTSIKRENRSLDPHLVKPLNHTLLICEHKPVYTLGKSGKIENLLASERELTSQDVDFYKINRGGDITFHGPGQLICYPLFDLDAFFTDIHRFVRELEEVVIRTLADFSISAERVPGFTGVWLEPDSQGTRKKICAIGVHVSRWVTMHGFALNVNTDLAYFQQIIPCGIKESSKQVTSMAQELGQQVDVALVKREIITHFSAVFGFNYEITRKKPSPSFPT